MNWREFRFARKKKADLVWMIAQDENTYHTKHGQLDGKLQLNSDTPGSKGKEDTKAYVNEIDNCTFHINREIRKKVEAGYIEYIDGEPTEKQVDSIDFNDYLPKVFTSYKPQTSIKEEAHKKIFELNKARYTRKYDGMAHIAAHHSWGWEIYSRRMDLSSERFPHHLRELQNTTFGVGTILIGEMVCFAENGKDDFKAISRVCRSEPELSRKIIHDKEVPEPKLVIFDVLFHDGVSLDNKSYDERAELFKWDFTPAKNAKSDNYICSVDYFDLSPDNWEDTTKSNGWEGFVIVDGRAVPGDKFYSFNGKAKRPKGSFKLKPVYEEDVVIYAALKGTGKRINGIGSVFVKQIHSETKKWFNCGKVGSGFSDDSLVQVEKLIEENNIPILSKDKEADALDLSNGNGIVAMIEYSERLVKTNKFRFPVFKRVRFDKTVEECETQRLAPDE